MSRLLSILALCIAPLAHANDVSISLDPAQRFQTIRAWEATVNLFWTDAIDSHRDEIMDRSLDEIGITRLRVGIFAGTENRDRSFDRFRTGQIDMKAWRATRYATVNDNRDPFTINWDGFDFANLDWRMTTTVLPMLEKARARGQKLELVFNYVAFTKQTRRGGYHHSNAEEYAEFVLATYLHLQKTYGIVPDYWEVILEPDLVREWTPRGLGAAMAAASRRLRAAGFTPRFIAPSVTNMANALPYLDGIQHQPDALRDFVEFSYHRYKGGTIQNLRAIEARARGLGVPTSMLELFNGRGTYPKLHLDLSVGNVVAWQGRALLGQYAVDGRGGIAMQNDVRFLAQYFRNIRPGDQRIGARSSQPRAFDPVAFAHPTGGTTLVLKAEKPGRVTVTGLPAGRYAVSHAGPRATRDLGQATIDGTGGLTVSVPGKGVTAIVAARR